MRAAQSPYQAGKLPPSRPCWPVDEEGHRTCRRSSSPPSTKREGRACREHMQAVSRDVTRGGREEDTTTTRGCQWWVGRGSLLTTEPPGYTCRSVRRTSNWWKIRRRRCHAKRMSSDDWRRRQSTRNRLVVNSVRSEIGRNYLALSFPRTIVDLTFLNYFPLSPAAILARGQIIIFPKVC